MPLSATRRNRSWEANGLLNLITGLEDGTLPAPTQLTTGTADEAAERGGEVVNGGY